MPNYCQKKKKKSDGMAGQTFFILVDMCEKNLVVERRAQQMNTAEQ